jgi:HSP20 family protein
MGGFFSIQKNYEKTPIYMAELIKNNKRSLLRLFWNNPLDHFYGSDKSDIAADGLLQIIPSLTVKETDRYYTIQLVVDGLSKEDFHVELEGNFLTIFCEKELKPERDSKEYVAPKEYVYTSFSRSFTLPDNADVEQVSAMYEEGLLVLRINKKPEAKIRNEHNINIDWI